MTESSARDILRIGRDVVVDGIAYTLVRYVDLYSILAVRVDTGEKVRVAIASLLAAMGRGEAEVVDDANQSSRFESLSADDWELAQRRATALAPLLAAEHPSRKEIAEVGQHLGVHVATIYRWIKKLKEGGDIADLAPHKPSGGRGASRLDPLADALIRENLEQRYLQPQRPLISQVMRDIELACRRAGIAAPHPNTVRRRVAELSEQLVTQRRLGRKAADDKFAARPGSFPGADYPGAYWQIDHTPLDVVIVDDVHRRHIGRPWLTVAIDVYSRCVAGFYLSLDPPSEVSVGMCLVHAILPKDSWLSVIGVETRWPMWGTPAAVHADNGKEFHGSMITRAAQAYRFRVEWRKVKTPNWGGHIERLMGTFNEEVHLLPGTTFANTRDRGTYAPHTEAVLTLRELERYLTEYICNVYHQRVHTGIDRPPIKRYEVGVLGDGVTPGVGLPPPVADAKRLRLDFMPLIERSIQSYGLRIDGLSYYDPVLDPWIRSVNPETKRPRRFMVRRDPRDISVIYFLDPTTNRYYAIPFRHLEHPSISMWELREVRAQLRKEGRREVDEDLIFQTYERLNQMVADAQAHSVKARKAQQKKRDRVSRREAEDAQENVSRSQAKVSSLTDDWDDDSPVEPFAIRLVH
ncbi:putative transposase [Luteibacter sp. HA06]